jgi:hypothetical protein
MIIAILGAVALMMIGFGAGRVKNAAKLAAVEAEIAKVEGSAVADVKKLVAAIKAKL